MKVDRGLIIRLDKNQTSIDFAEKCADSCSENGLLYEFMDAVDKHFFRDPQDIMKSVGYMLTDKRYNNIKKNPFGMGHIACHASMIKCWKRIVELNKCCIILEHDALVLGDVTTLDIPDMAVVTFGHIVPNEYYYKPPSPATKLVKLEKSAGCHAYAITPKTAKHLLNESLKGINFCVDNYLMRGPSSGLPIYVCEPPQAVGVCAKSTILDTDRVFDPTAYTKISFTEGWVKGIKK